MSAKNRKDVVVGSVEIDENEFAPQNVKIRVTTMIDEDALQGLKRMADERGIKYQTLLNKIVRSYVVGPKKPYGRKQELTEEKVREIVRQEIRKKKA